MAFSRAALASLRFPASFVRKAVETPALLGAALVIACGGEQTGDERGETGSVLQELRGTAARVAAGGDMPNSASDDGWSFGWKLYAEEARPNENVFFSPYSISVASAMLVAGAAGETKSEMDRALSFSGDSGPDFHQARNSIAQALERRNRAGSMALQAQALHVSNDLWLVPNFRPHPAYLNTLSAYYGIGTFLAPFDTDPEAARQAINGKVSDDTEQLIPEVLPEGSVNGAALVLTNALYFKARWSTEFSKSATRDQAFVNAAGETETVPMMHEVFDASYYENGEYEAIALSYFGAELELVAIMPTTGTFAAFVQNLSAAQVATAAGKLTSARLDLAFPKFGVTSQVPLKERLQALGMLQAFDDGAADFSGLSDEELFVSGAFHNAVLKLDEEGTEAAAATALVITPESVPPTPIPVVFDHPFVFFIRDIPTNALLFVGHYANP